jgi:hypothetical protein
MVKTRFNFLFLHFMDELLILLFKNETEIRRGKNIQLNSVFLI